MATMRERGGLVAMLVALSVAAVGQKPDLHGTGAVPTTIPNHETTKVMKDGSHLAGAVVTADGACRLASYSTTENEITMYLTGARAVSGDETCFYHVKNSYGTASSWIVVSYTDDEERQVEAAKRAAGEAKAAQMLERAGKEWTIHFADGTTQVYAFSAAAEPGTGLFSGPGGKHLKILVGDNQTVLLRDDSDCMRIGKLEQGRVKDGKTYGGSCAPAGAWTAEVR